MAQAPVRAISIPDVCNIPAARDGSDVMAIAVVRFSGIFSACTNFDARDRPKVPEPPTDRFLKGSKGRWYLTAMENCNKVPSIDGNLQPSYRFYKKLIES